MEDNKKDTAAENLHQSHRRVISKFIARKKWGNPIKAQRQALKTRMCINIF